MNDGWLVLENTKRRNFQNLRLNETEEKFVKFREGLEKYGNKD